MMLPAGQDQLIKRSSSSASSAGRHLPSTPVAIPPYPPTIPSSSSAVANFQVAVDMFSLRKREITAYEEYTLLTVPPTIVSK